MSTSDICTVPEAVKSAELDEITARSAEFGKTPVEVNQSFELMVKGWLCVPSI